MQALQPFIVAVDGFSSCGKSTFAKAIAKNLGFIYIDSGAMYRAFALYCLQNNIIADGIVDESRLPEAVESIIIEFKISATQAQEVFLNGADVEEEIRTQRVSEVVSIVAGKALVRKSLITLQQQMGLKKGIVMDGRDIGTVVFPEAELKIFMTASGEIRARRRYDELIQKGQQVAFEEIKANIEERDRLDLTREISPLVQSEDALTLDNSNMTPDAQMVWLKNLMIQNNLIKA